MKVIICPGVHETQLTDRFLNSCLATDLTKEIKTIADNFLIFPTKKYPAYSPFHLYQWLKKSKILNDELLFICFSAGVVSGMGTAFFLQFQGVKIKALIAIDGWGVPLIANFPVYRFSHDYFTHWSSALLGTGTESFYCDPEVEHLTLWEFPEQCEGWIVKREKRDPGKAQEQSEGLTLRDREYLKTKSSARDYLQKIIIDNYLSLGYSPTKSR